jgi:erythromycin esterase-like protein
MKSMLDYSVLAEKLKDKLIVGIGESTHGTHEFFEAKVKIFKILVTEHSFNTFFFEAMDDDCEAINKYIHAGEGHLNDLINRLFPIYRTDEIKNLITWLRDNVSEYPVDFIGIDQRRRVKNYLPYNIYKASLRDKDMALTVKNYIKKKPDSRAMIWAHDTHVAAYANPLEWAPEARHIPMGENLREWFGDDYYCIAQLFGSGDFNAALIDKSGKSNNSVLIPHNVPKAPKNFWENLLASKYRAPTFLEEPEFERFAKNGEVHYKRALGYGINPSETYKANNIRLIDIVKAYDGIIFLPNVTASHVLGSTKK